MASPTGAGAAVSAADTSGDETTATYDVAVKRWRRQFTDVVSKDATLPIPAVLWSLIGSYAVELGTFYRVWRIAFRLRALTVACSLLLDRHII
jgi:hypothetical protein